MHFI
ncbi:hypothetical protein F383_14823 [Gossypium arboreum]